MFSCNKLYTLSSSIQYTLCYTSQVVLYAFYSFSNICNDFDMYLDINNILVKCKDQSHDDNIYHI